MYNFTSFAVSLNELEKGMEAILAPTDCRLRPDIRNMENGNMGMCFLEEILSHSEVLRGGDWREVGWYRNIVFSFSFPEQP